jgi:hypothetical protein
MKLFSWLRSRKTTGPGQKILNLEPPTTGIQSQQGADPLNQIHWIPAAENPLCVDVLDCSAFALSMVTTTSRAEVAARFTELRGSQGEHCRGKDVNNSLVTCRLEYPFDNPVDGPVFRADQMEDKWDVFLLDGDLYFSRSWSGDLAYIAKTTFENSKAIVTQIRGQREPGSSENPVAVVDYLIKSHVYGLVAPHPLPTDQTNFRDLALWSFSRYGRRGLLGTKEDVTHLVVNRNQDGGFTIGHKA